MEEIYSSFGLIALAIWALPWKGVALWRAARRGHKKWFIVLLVLNTLSLLDMVYIFFVSKKKKPEPEVEIVK